MSKTRSWKSDIFSTPTGADAVAAQSIRDALTHSVLDGHEIFVVRVLSKPLPLQPHMAGAILGAASSDLPPSQPPSEQEAAAEVFVPAALLDPNAAPTNRFYFKGRVEMEGFDSSKTMSNFHNILPDPCNLPLTYAPDIAIRILAMYPTFVSKVGYTGKQPSVGELVEVTMQQGDFAQSGQWNIFNTLTEAQNAVLSQELKSNEKCAPRRTRSKGASSMKPRAQ